MKTSKVLELRNLSPASYLLRFTRENIDFKPGQHLVIGYGEEGKGREYSIYSGVNDDYLEILVREVIDGKISHMLKNLTPGDEVQLNGPFGFFLSNINPPQDKKLLFIASGTGIAPFHSYIKSFPDTNYKLIHGIRTSDEAYENHHYRKEKYITCTSRDSGGAFSGRVTDYLKNMPIDKDSLIFFCGNNNMIQDAIEILLKKGFSYDQMFTEVYF